MDVAYLDFFAPDTRATDQRLPDLAANVSKAGDWGYFSLSGVVRDIRFRTTIGGVSEAQSAVGYGANLMGGFRLFKSEEKADVLYYQIIAGQGLGRYLVSLSGQNADAAPRPRERRPERRPGIRRIRRVRAPVDSPVLQHAHRRRQHPQE